MTRLRLPICLVAALLVATSACASSSRASGSTAAGPSSTTAPYIDPGDGGNYHPSINPSDFTDIVDNRYLPFLRGSHWTYQGTVDGADERTEVTVLEDTKTVMGVKVVAVHDAVTADGVLTEDTTDWYAQDRAGNVWYFGEATTAFVKGKPASHHGSWEAGVDGALPGIVMTAAPTVGTAHRQEYRKGEAEDMYKVTAVGGHLAVAAGAFDEVVTTTEWTPLEPDQKEQKQYASGVGLIRDETVTGTPSHTDLVDYSIPR